MPEASILLKTYDLPPDLTDEWLDTVRQCRAAGVMIQVLHAHGSIASAVQRARDRGLLFVTFVHFRRYKVDDLIQLTADQVDYALTMHHHNLERLRDGFQLR